MHILFTLFLSIKKKYLIMSGKCVYVCAPKCCLDTTHKKIQHHCIKIDEKDLKSTNTNNNSKNVKSSDDELK